MKTDMSKCLSFTCLISAFFFLSTAFHTSTWASEDKNVPKYGPENNPIAIPLSHSSEYFRHPKHTAPDFWRLMPYYVSQFNGGACSVATVAMIVNGFVRATHGFALKDQDTNVSQLDLVLNKNQHQWQGKMTEKGFEGRLGLKLESLNLALRESLIAFGAPNVQTKMVQTNEITPQALSEFRSALEENEKSARDFIVVHFLQDMLTRAEGGPYPHISPIGAYDKKNRTVLILDVDRKWYEPYWVPDRLLLEAMAAKTRAFGHGGYVRIWQP